MYKPFTLFVVFIILKIGLNEIGNKVVFPLALKIVSSLGLLKIDFVVNRIMISTATNYETIKNVWN